MSIEENDYKITKHVCPRNCYGACGMVAYTKNGILEKVNGDPDHEYTKGKICAKGYSYINRVYHRDRIKYPLIQEKRGSGKWRRISWNKALSLISSKIFELNKRYDSNLSLCLNKYSGNFGVLHNAVEGFFNGLGETTRVIGSPCWSAGLDAQHYDFGGFETSDPSEMQKAKLIILWGVNPAWTAVHSLPFIYSAQDQGAKVVVIDPIRTTTAKKADEYIQIRPAGDGALAIAIAKILIKNDLHDQTFIDQYTLGWELFKNYIESVNMSVLVEQSGIHEEVITSLAEQIGTIKPCFMWLGFGLQRHTNGGQNIRAIDALCAMTGNIGIPGSGINFAQLSTWKYTYDILTNKNIKNRIIEIGQFSDQIKNFNNPPIKFLWVSCRNILSQDPQQSKVIDSLKGLEMIVTVDHFLTATALQSDIVLPATTQFEEEDIVSGYWHHVVGLNEKAIEPYFESKSDLDIAKALSHKLNQESAGFSLFATEGDSRDFIDREFNEEFYQQLQTTHWSELKETPKRMNIPKTAWKDRVFKTPSTKYEFYSERASKDGFFPLPQFKAGMRPSSQYPYWLLTPHSQFGLNSQFQNLDWVSSMNPEPYIYLNPNLAAEKGISKDHMIRVFNQFGEIHVKVKTSIDVPIDIILFYQSWFPNSNLSINVLVPGHPTDMGKISTGSRGIAYYDTFVDLEKIQ